MNFRYVSFNFGWKGSLLLFILIIWQPTGKLLSTRVIKMKNFACLDCPLIKHIISLKTNARVVG